MFPHHRPGRPHDGEPPWQEGREFAAPFLTGERSPPPAFLEPSPSPPFPVQRRMERPWRLSSASGRREEGDGSLVERSEPRMTRSWHVDLPERRWREGDYGAGPRFLERSWHAPSEAPMVRRRPELDDEYNCKRARVLEPSQQHYWTQGTMERGRGRSDDFELSSRFLGHAPPMAWSPPRYDERDREPIRARIFEGAMPWPPPDGERWCRGSPTPGRHEEFLGPDWPSPSEPPMRHRDHYSARQQESSRQRPTHRGDGFAMRPPAYFEPSRHSPMEHGRERSPPRILEDRRPWTPPPRDRERRWGGLPPGSDGHSWRFLENPEVYGRSPPGTRTEGYGLQGPRSWREKGGPTHSAGLNLGHQLHAGGRLTSSTLDQSQRGGGTLPRRFVRERRGIRQAIHGSSGCSGRQRSPRPRSKKPADSVNSAPIAEAQPQTEISGLNPLVGVCEDTQKGFFRLTGPADPSKVRPKIVLAEALKLLQDSDKDYSFKSDQLKSIRQDLAVQNIEDEFSIKVYEFHARLALSNRDISELNVCLARLQELYGMKLNDQSGEFLAYDILLSATQGKNLELMSKLRRLPRSLKQHDAVKHAQTVTQSMRTGNYVQFFKLYKSAPNLSGQLMGLSFDKMRFEALKCFTKAYAQNVPLEYIASILAFEGVQATADWIGRHGAAVCSEGKELVPKESVLCLPDPFSEDTGVLESMHSLKRFPPDAY